MASYCNQELGGVDILVSKLHSIKSEELRDMGFSDLPLFLNKGLIALGSLSLANKSDRNLKRGISEWGSEDLKYMELGYRELHSKELPVITLDKIICTVSGKNPVPYSAFVDVGILRDGVELLSTESIGFVYKRKTKGVVYLERAEKYKRNSSFSFENAL